MLWEVSLFLERSEWYWSLMEMYALTPLGFSTPADTWKCWSERIWSCYISRETWIHALYIPLNWRKRHVRNLFREKDINHFDNQMCGRHFLLKPGVHKLLEIKQFSDKLPQMKWLLTNQQTENGAIASWHGFQSLHPSRWALAHKISWHPPQKLIRINHFLT